NYARIVDRAKAEPDFAPDAKAVTGIRMRLANCYRQMQEYDKALELYTAILKAKQGNLTAQIDAAYVLQESGDYTAAIVGAVPIPRDPGKFYIWGWAKIGKLTA